MKKNLVKITEGDLHRIVENSVKRYLNETSATLDSDKKYWGKYCNEDEINNAFNKVYQKAEECANAILKLSSLDCNNKNSRLQKDIFNKYWNMLDKIKTDFNPETSSIFDAYMNQNNVEKGDSLRGRNNTMFNPFTKKYEVMSTKDAVNIVRQIKSMDVKRLSNILNIGENDATEIQDEISYIQNPIKCLETIASYYQDDLNYEEYYEDNF